MHPIRTVRLQLYRSKIGNAIRSNILFGISNLVQKLLFDRLLAYQASGTFMLGNVKVTIRFGFNNGKSNIHKVINLFPISKVASRNLGATLDKMARNRSR